MRTATTQEVARELGVTDRSVRSYAASGRLPFSVTPGGHRRFDLDEVRDALIRKAAVHAAPTLADIRRHRRQINAAARRHGASDVRVFGSVASGSAGNSSDVDFLVRLEYGRTYADVDDLERDLAQIIGYEVDVVTEGSCHGHLAHVLDEALPL